MQTRSNLLRGGFVFAAAVLAAGCADRTSPAGPGEGAVMGSIASPVPGMTIDERFVQMAREIPGFGGYYRDPQGNLNVVLTNPDAQGEAARAALASVLRAGRGRGMIMRQGRFDFAQLQGWREKVDPAVLGINGVAFTDVNEVTNRVEIGISDASVRDRVRQAVSGLSIPPAAIELVDAEPAEEHATLRERVRPTTGGLKITWVADNAKTYQCTLGFSVLVAEKYGYFTNSHCTNDGVNTVHRQAGSNSRIGAEVQDPARFPYGSTQTFNSVSYTCNSSNGCRFSDASRGVFDDSVQAQVKHGYIARTQTENEYQGEHLDTLPSNYKSTMYVIDSSNPYFRIVGKANHVAVGDVIHKVGQKTGWTSGVVNRTCVNSVFDTTTKWCQLRKGVEPTQLAGYNGDSGSPVFRRVPGSETDVELVGLYWGSAISPITNIERDMGMTFDVTAP
ncbi:MAG TPA: hypothetical protein VHG93_27040 [Longimicrobium sp.]|nr:hypothetical protein [Longimicrobium sp.]